MNYAEGKDRVVGSCYDDCLVALREALAVRGFALCSRAGVSEKEQVNPLRGGNMRSWPLSAAIKTSVNQRLQDKSHETTVLVVT